MTVACILCSTTEYSISHCILAKLVRSNMVLVYDVRQDVFTCLCHHNIQQLKNEFI